MNYMKLISALRQNNLNIFSLQDIKNLFPEEKDKTLKNNFTRWIKKGLFLRIRKDIYEFIEPGTKSRLPDIYIANKLYSPSYVSLETALSIYGLIPEVAAHVTSLTTKPTRVFKNRYGSFFYRTCQKQAFSGYRIMEYEGVKVWMADMEKALVDFLYYGFRGRKDVSFDEERFNKKFLKKIKWTNVHRYALLFNVKTVRLVKALKEWCYAKS